MCSPRPLSGALVSGSLPPYDEGATGQSSADAYHPESESDDFGTIVTSVTTKLPPARGTEFKTLERFLAFRPYLYESCVA